MPISLWVLGFCAVFVGGLFAAGFADLGKRRRWVAFRADSVCETAQKFANRVRVRRKLRILIRALIRSAGRRSRMGKRLKPTGVQAISRKLVWWRGKCGHVYQMAVRDRAGAKPGCCPHCSGRKRSERPIRLD